MRALLPIFLLAAPALAQDSVSRNANAGNGLPGDAVAPWANVYQRSSFVVDLAPLTTSWGQPLGIAPLLKSARINTARFNAATIAATISPDLRAGVPFPSPSYTLWTQPTGGIHTADNVPALNTLITPTGNATVFAVACLDADEQISTLTLHLANVAQGALVAYSPDQPDRLYVTRVLAMQNAPGFTQPDRSQLGLGSIDADGNLHLRADSFASAGTTAPLLGDNYLRVRLPARAGSPNTLDNNGPSNAAATDWLLQRDARTHAVPGAIPAQAAGRPVLVGADFIARLAVESSPGSLVPTTAHRAGALDHRGSATVIPRPLFPSGVATAAILTRSAATPSADSIALASLDANGAILASRLLTLPPTLSDPCQPFAWTTSQGGLRGYDSQVIFRGPVGSVAIGQDAQGRALAAGVLHLGTTADPATPFNAIAIARVDLSNPSATPQWTIAAWLNPALADGKDIRGDFGLDGTPNTNDPGEGDGVVDALDAPIGRLASPAETLLGVRGPSLSAPAFDSAGNLYFMAPVLLNRTSPSGIVQVPTTALLRGRYDPAAFCYALELVLAAGDVFRGRNSDRNYKITSLFLADSDSASSASLWASSVASGAWNAIPPASLDPADPRALAGLVVIARIVYDVDQDAVYADPTRPGDDPASVDEAYNVVLYIGNTQAGTGPAPCDPDFNQDGNVDQDDVACLAQVVAGDPSCSDMDPDFNRDGNVDQDDIEALTQVVAGGSCP
jgi:hypothetical protein